MAPSQAIERSHWPLVGSALNRRSLLIAALAWALLLVTASTAAAVALPPPTPEVARPADDFVDTVGVNVHLHYQGTVYDSAFDTVVRPKLVALGVRHVRDHAYTYSGVDAQTFYYKRCRALAAAGIRFELVTDLNAAAQPTDYAKLPALSAWCDGAVEAFEGASEPDMQSIPPGAPDWRTQTIQSQQALFSAVKGSPPIGGLAVVGPSIAFSPDQVGDLSPYLNYGNWHPYPGGECPTCGDVYRQTIDTFLPKFRGPSGRWPMIVSETGYHNAVDAPAQSNRPVSELAAGKYLPRLLLEYFNRGFARTYLYEFIDAHSDPGESHPDDHFGLLRNDGSEKPGYRAVRSLLGLLTDPGGRFSPGTLAYRLSGATDRVHHTLLQKRDGTFYLALWQERSGYDTGARPNAPDDVAARRDLAAPEQRVTLSVQDTIRRATLYRLSEAGTLSSGPAAVDRGSVDLAVSDRVEVLKLATAGPGPADPGANEPPRLTRLRMKHRVFAPAGRLARISRRSRVPRGTAFRYTLSEPATVTIAISRVLPGRRLRRGREAPCVAVRRSVRRSRRCLRHRWMGNLRVRNKAGRQSTPFSGRLNGRPLKPGRYRVRLSAIDDFGARSKERFVRFTVRRR